MKSLVSKFSYLLFLGTIFNVFILKADNYPLEKVSGHNSEFLVESNNQKSDLVMRLFSILLYIFSFGNAFNTSRMLQIYLKKVEKEKKSKKHPFPDYVSFKHWKNYLIMGYFFCFILVVLFILATKRFVVNLF